MKNNARTDNGRFYESGGVSPQTVLCKFASTSPARTFVNPRLHKAAGTLYASGGDSAENRNTKNIKIEYVAKKNTK